MELKELTKQLCRLGGPSGFEAPVFACIEEYMRPYADEVKTDPLGNFLAIKYCGRPNARRVLLDAHMDEIGLIVTAVEDGYLRFAALGGVDARMLPAREVRVLGETPLFGVIDTMPPHLLEAGETDKTIPIDKLRIDVGLSQEEAEKAAPPGTPVVYAEGCEELGSAQLCGKALDDRSCAAIIMKAFVELTEQDLNVDLCLQISTQEELSGYRGATVGTWTLAPDCAIAVDVTHAKTPDGQNVTIEGGKGAAIGVGPNMNRAMTNELIAVAKEKNIPYQIEVAPGGNSGTNTSAIQVSRSGVATALISLPLKYMHTPVETVWHGDMQSILRLIVEYVGGMEG